MKKENNHAPAWQKYLASIILVVGIFWFAIYPPRIGTAQPNNIKAKAAIYADSLGNTPEIKQLMQIVNQKANEAAILAQKKPETITVTKIKKPETITIYTRIDGIVTEHKVTSDSGFYILDLDKQKEGIVYVDTCINKEYRQLWNYLFFK